MSNDTNCTQQNPCSCLGKYYSNGQGGTSSSCAVCPAGDCLLLGNILISPENSVFSGGETGTVSFDCFEYCACGEVDPIFKITDVSHPDYFSDLQIDHEGLTFTTSLVALSNVKITVYFLAKCGSFSDSGSVDIYLKDKCEGVVCIGECQECNPLTGVCDCENTEPIIIDNCGDPCSSPSSSFDIKIK